MLVDEERHHLESLMSIHRSNLHILEEQQAKYGDLDVPLHIINNITEQRNQIAELEAKLGIASASVSSSAPTSASITVGLTALGEMMYAPAARHAVVAFRTDFEAACDNISIVSTYKALHDLFHKLESHYNVIYREARRVQHGGADWDLLVHIDTDLRGTTDEILERITAMPSGAETTLWIQRLNRGCEALNKAITDSDSQLLNRVTVPLKEVLGSALSRINTRLVSAASVLRLADLVQKLMTICASLRRLNLDQTDAQRFIIFEEGVTELDRLNIRLVQILVEHNTFQAIDDELRRIEAQIEQDMAELIYAWNDVKPLLIALCAHKSIRWAVKLIEVGAELEALLPTTNVVLTRRSFQRLRSEATRGFNQVDHDLLDICGMLQKIGEPLTVVLRMIE